MSQVMLTLNLIHILLFFFNPKCGNAGCASIATCCPGTNNSCSQQLNGIDSNCYCDQACLSSDCCSDYADYCINRGENTKQNHNDAMHYLQSFTTETDFITQQYNVIVAIKVQGNSIHSCNYEIIHKLHIKL